MPRSSFLIHWKQMLTCKTVVFSMRTISRWPHRKVHDCDDVIQSIPPCRKEIKHHQIISPWDQGGEGNKSQMFHMPWFLLLRPNIDTCITAVSNNHAGYCNVIISQVFFCVRDSAWVLLQAQREYYFHAFPKTKPRLNILEEQNTSV